MRPPLSLWNPKLTGSASGIADYLVGKMGEPHVVLGPLCFRQDVPKPYFVVGTVDEGGDFRLYMVQVNAESDRAAIIASLSMKRLPLVMHVCGDEPSAAKWCHTIWPCEKTKILRDGVEADYAVISSA